MSTMATLDLDPDALGGLLSAWRAEVPTCALFALVPEAEAARIPVLQEVCRALGVPLVGAVFPALVNERGFSTSGVALLRLDSLALAVLVEDLSAGSATVGHTVAERVGPALRDEVVPNLFLVFDATFGRVASVLESLYLELSDRVSYAGVLAGSETFQPIPCLFDQDRLVGGGVWCLLLEDRPYPVLEHGYSPPSRALAATATEANRIRTIDWRPAFDVYRELVKADYGVELTRENFYAYGVHFPFGILRAAGELVVRIPVALTDDGAIVCVGEVPTHSVLVLLEGPRIDTTRCVEDVARRLEETRDVRGRNLLTFYCAGRKMHMGEGAQHELAALHERTGAAQMSGALTLGEIGGRHAWSYPFFHNATLVCTEWGEP